MDHRTDPGRDDGTILADVPKAATDLLAMPDDGIERWQIDDQIRVVRMTIRYKLHTQT